MIPRPKMVAWESWLAENTATVRSRSPTPPCLAKADIASASMIGSGTCQPTR